MFQDLLERPLSGDLETDLCIIGAGAAGITIARQLDGTGIRVCLLESGGTRARSEAQNLYGGYSEGMYYPVKESRLRFFGGTTNHWTGVCGLQDPLDFQPRPWIGSLGWPFTREALMPFYERAHEVLDLGPFEYDPARTPAWPMLPRFDPDKLTIGMMHFSPPTRFGPKYAGVIDASQNVLCLLHANVVDFDVTHDASRVSAVRVATLAGGECRVRAQVFVLACGGLENPRLLLNASATPGGLGNSSGLVGRYFADHMHHSDVATVITEGDWWKAFGPIWEGTARSSPMICMGEAAQRDEGLLSCRTDLVPTEAPPGVRPGAVCLAAFSHCEQVLSAENRVELSDERDALGLRRIRLHWTISEVERAAMKRCIVLLAEEIGRLKLGHVRLDARLDSSSDISESLWRGSHHMCTTRMSEDPRQGVVDADCRMHGVDNMYMAGSSVFPCSGQMNPTMTIIALALRLSDHLAALLGARGSG